MEPLPDGAAWLSFDGTALRAGRGPGRAFMVDGRCLEAPSAGESLAHVCALVDEDAAIPFDQPEVQQVRRDALAWWLPLLGRRLVCLTMLALDESRCAGAITVVRGSGARRVLADDPFARLFPGTVVATDAFRAVAPPAGPIVERYAGVAWPGGSFA